MKIKDIRINPKNPRYIKDDRFRLLVKNIKEFPKMMKLRPIIVDDNGMIIGGNMRYLALIDLKYKDIPEGWVVKASELSEGEKERFKILDNVPFGNWDFDILANEWDLGKLQDWGVEIPEIEMNIEAEEDDFDVDKAVEEVGEPTCKRGDLWQLGEHWLMCGDATVEADVKRLIKDNLMDISFCDPPYNIGYDYWDYLDKKEAKQYKQWCEVWFKYLIQNVPIVILTIGKWNLKMWYGIEKPLGTAIWIARNKTSGSKISLFSVWEPILVYAKKIKRRKISNDILSGDLRIDDDIIINDIETAKNFISENNDIFEINNKRQKDVGTHKCPKQLTLMKSIFQRYSLRGCNVLDLFGGSGSTLIACEQLNRKCYMMEIDPIYCDVIIKRWEQYTNKKAVKING